MVTYDRWIISSALKEADIKSKGMEAMFVDIQGDVCDIYTYVRRAFSPKPPKIRKVRVRDKSDPKVQRFYREKHQFEEKKIQLEISLQSRYDPKIEKKLQALNAKWQKQWPISQIRELPTREKTRELTEKEEAEYIASHTVYKYAITHKGRVQLNVITSNYDPPLVENDYVNELPKGGRINEHFLRLLKDRRQLDKSVKNLATYVENVNKNRGLNCKVFFDLSSSIRLKLEGITFEDLLFS